MDIDFFDKRQYYQSIKKNNEARIYRIFKTSFLFVHFEVEPSTLHFTFADKTKSLQNYFE